MLRQPAEHRQAIAAIDRWLAARLMASRSGEESADDPGPGDRESHDDEKRGVDRPAEHLAHMGVEPRRLLLGAYRPGVGRPRALLARLRLLLEEGVAAARDAALAEHLVALEDEERRERRDDGVVDPQPHHRLFDVGGKPPCALLLKQIEDAALGPEPAD